MNSVLQSLTLPLQPIYAGLNGLKNLFYDQGLSQTLKVPAPVVSVGNLSMGGTGKTPVVLSLSKNLGRLYRRPVIISRSYKSPLREPVSVQLGNPAGAAIYGDEAFELAEKSAALVYTGPSKWRTAIKAWLDVKPDLLIVDDGFQHRSLHRDFDLVLIDATETQNQLLPVGRLRESFQSLRRADAILITKVNWARPEELEVLRQRIRYAIGKETRSVFEVGFDWENKSRIAEQSFGRPVALVSAVGRNEVLRTRLESVLSRPLDQVWVGRDHHLWKQTEAQAIIRWLNDHPDGLVFTTEKDEVKLRRFLGTEKRVIPLKLSLDWQGRETELTDLIQKTISMRCQRKGLSPDLESGPWP